MVSILHSFTDWLHVYVEFVCYLIADINIFDRKIESVTATRKTTFGFQHRLLIMIFMASKYLATHFDRIVLIRTAHFCRMSFFDRVCFFSIGCPLFRASSIQPRIFNSIAHLPFNRASFFRSYIFLLIRASSSFASCWFTPISSVIRLVIHLFSYCAWPMSWFYIANISKFHLQFTNTCISLKLFLFRHYLRCINSKKLPNALKHHPFRF